MQPLRGESCDRVDRGVVADENLRKIPGPVVVVVVLRQHRLEQRPNRPVHSLDLVLSWQVGQGEAPLDPEALCSLPHLLIVEFLSPVTEDFLRCSPGVDIGSQTRCHGGGFLVRNCSGSGVSCEAVHRGEDVHLASFCTVQRADRVQIQDFTLSGLEHWLVPRLPVRFGRT